MKQTVDLYSPRSPEQIARKLKAIMADPMDGAKARVIGSGTQELMVLRYARRNRQDAMAPILDATMEPYEGGTRISGTLGPSPIGRWFPVFWFGFLSIFVVVGVAVMWLVPGTVPFGLIFAGVPIFMMIIGGFVFRKPAEKSDDGEQILAFLRRELDTRPIA